ncbi:MAG: hypothetical protein QW334_00210 [Thermofilum sp.]
MSWSKAFIVEFAMPAMFTCMALAALFTRNEGWLTASMMGIILSLQVIILLWLRTLIIVMKKVVEALAEYSAALAEIRIRDFEEAQARRGAGLV